MSMDPKQFAKALDSMADRVESTAGTILPRAADIVEDELRDSTPVRTGRTRDAWKQERISPSRIDVVNPLPHASVLDRGSSKQAPNGITATAVPRAVKRIGDAIESELRK